LKQERREAKKLRNKIVGAGNTMDSYGDKFMSMKGTLRNRNTTSHTSANSVRLVIFLLRGL